MRRHEWRPGVSRHETNGQEGEKDREHSQENVGKSQPEEKPTVRSTVMEEDPGLVSEEGRIYGDVTLVER